MVEWSPWSPTACSSGRQGRSARCASKGHPVEGHVRGVGAAGATRATLAAGRQGAAGARLTTASRHCPLLFSRPAIILRMQRSYAALRRHAEKQEGGPTCPTESAPSSGLNQA